MTRYEIEGTSVEELDRELEELAGELNFSKVYAPKQNGKTLHDVSADILKIVLERQGKRIRNDWRISNVSTDSRPPWDWLHHNCRTWIGHAKANPNVKEAKVSGEDLVYMAIVGFVDERTPPWFNSHGASAQDLKSLVQTIVHVTQDKDFVKAFRHVYNCIERTSHKLSLHLVSALEELRKNEDQLRAAEQRLKEEAERRKAGEKRLQKEAEVAKQELKRKHDNRRKEAKEAVRSWLVGCMEDFLQTDDPQDPAWNLEYIQELLGIAEHSSGPRKCAERKELIIGILSGRLSNIKAD